MINGTDMSRFLVQNIAQAQEMLEAVNHPALKCNMTVTIWQWWVKMYLTVYKKNIHQIGHIQFADCPGRHEPDTAQIPYEQIFSWIKQSAYEGYIAAEYKPKNGSNQSFTWKNKYFSDDVNI